VPFDGATFNDLMFKIALEDAPSPESIVPDLDPGIGQILRRALAREVDQRFPTAAEFQRALDAWLATGTTQIIAPAPKAVAPPPAPDSTMMIDPSEASISEPRPSIGAAEATQLGATLQAHASAGTVAPTVAAGPLPAPASAGRSRWPLALAAAALLGGGLFTAYRVSRPARHEVAREPQSTSAPARSTSAIASDSAPGTVVSAPAVANTAASATASAMASATASASAAASASVVQAPLAGGSAAQPSLRPVRPKSPSPAPPPAPATTGDSVAGGRRLRTF
jgi:hypothetical protein